MPTLNNTPNRSYPEPYLGNDLATDVGRIIAALRAIDTDVADAFAQITSRAGLASPAFTGTPTAPTAVAGTQTNQLATTAFVAQALAALVGLAPDALDTIYELAAASEANSDLIDLLEAAVAAKADAAATTAALAGKADAAPTTAALQGKVDLTDPWSIQPVGVPIPLLDNLAALLSPPTNRSYRYIQLTAGLTGAGQYNNGVLTSESTTGTAPLVSSTAVINLAGSPLNGQTVSLINTEGRFLRASTAPGTLQNDQMQQITGQWNGAVNRSVIASASGGAFTPSGVTTVGYDTAGPSQSGYQSANFDSANSPGARAGTETRPKNIGVTYFMRVK